MFVGHQLFVTLPRCSPCCSPGMHSSHFIALIPAATTETRRGTWQEMKFQHFIFIFTGGGRPEEACHVQNVVCNVAEEGVYWHPQDKMHLPICLSCKSDYPNLTSFVFYFKRRLLMGRSSMSCQCLLYLSSAYSDVSPVWNCDSSLQYSAHPLLAGCRPHDFNNISIKLTLFR